MFRVELVMEVDPAHGREFEDVWLQVGKVVAEHPANIAQWLSRSDGENARFVIVSDWPDEKSFREFEYEPGHKELTGRLRELRKSGSMSTMTVLHHLAGAGAS